MGKKIEVKLDNKYSFGESVTVTQTTLADELMVEKKVIENDGAGQALFLIATSCGLTEDEAKSIYSSDAKQILKVLESF